MAELLLDIINSGRAASAGTGAQLALQNLLLAFVLGQLVAWVYIYTHSGLSYSRAFVQSIIVLNIIVTLAMMVIGSNIVIAFGLIGALSVIRFRNILKDTRDTAFIFLALTMGMACGTGSHGLAILGTLAISAVLLYLHWTAFGSRHVSDGFVRFHFEGKSIHRTLQAILRRHARETQLVSQRFAEGGAGEMAYRLTMRDPGRADELIAELDELEGLSHISFVAHEEQAEV